MREVGLSAVRVLGPLSGHAEGFGADLARQGYAPSSATDHLRLMGHLSRWLEAEGLDPTEFTAERTEDFLRVRRETHVRLVSERALTPLLGYLRGLGVVPESPCPVPCTGLERLLDDYRRFLVRERGLVAGSVVLYERVARGFLAGLPEPIEAHLKLLGAEEVTGFVLRECPGRSVSAARTVATGTRSLLRFLYLDGWMPRALASAVPGVAGWSMTSLPRAVGAEVAAKLIASCDPATPVGRRDHAILVLLARLGLRGQEVADAALGDIDWRAGELVIRGKGRRRERLPLPVDVGEALVGYLQQGRQRCRSRRLFVSVRAPIGPVSASAIRSVVRDACQRAGLPRIGAHRLRHTAATEMLRAGASLAEVGQVLRHRSPLTTANYAKVDRVALFALARPWPGAES